MLQRSVEDSPLCNIMDKTIMSYPVTEEIQSIEFPYVNAQCVITVSSILPVHLLD